MFAKQSASAIVSRSLLFVGHASSGNSILPCRDRVIWKTLRLPRARAKFWTSCGKRSIAPSKLNTDSRFGNEEIRWTRNLLCRVARHLGAAGEAKGLAA